VPFLLLSGYGNKVLPEDHRDWPVRSKPFVIEQVMAELAGLIAGG
jgi:hypothetical protein